jgi:acyl carrier protein
MLNSSGLQNRIATIFLEKLHLELPSVDTDLLGTGALDSLTFVNLLFHLEQDFGIKIPIEELEIDHFRTIASMASFIVYYKESANNDGSVFPGPDRSGRASKENT